MPEYNRNKVIVADMYFADQNPGMKYPIMASIYKAKWVNEIEKEMQSLHSNEVWNN